MSEHLEIVLLVVAVVCFLGLILLAAGMAHGKSVTLVFPVLRRRKNV